MFGHILGRQKKAKIFGHKPKHILCISEIPEISEFSLYRETPLYGSLSLVRFAELVQPLDTDMTLMCKLIESLVLSLTEVQ